MKPINTSIPASTKRFILEFISYVKNGYTDKWYQEAKNKLEKTEKTPIPPQSEAVFEWARNLKEFADAPFIGPDLLFFKKQTEHNYTVSLSVDLCLGTNVVIKVEIDLPRKKGLREYAHPLWCSCKTPRDLYIVTHLLSSGLLDEVKRVIDNGKVWQLMINLREEQFSVNKENALLGVLQIYFRDRHS